MNIRDSDNILFDEWKSQRDRFVTDGVVDELTYLASHPRLLFILKEANDPDGTGWDLREYLRNGARSQTWDNVTRWVEGIRRIREDIRWDDLATIDLKRRRKALMAIAVMNLKKSPGGYATDPSLMAKFVEEDREFLNRQFSLYDPELVICCGRDTSDAFHSVIDFPQPPYWKTTRRGVCYHEVDKQIKIFAFAHHEARVADSLLYYGLIDAIREVMIQQ